MTPRAIAASSGSHGSRLRFAVKTNVAVHVFLFYNASFSLRRLPTAIDPQLESAQRCMALPSARPAQLSAIGKAIGVPGCSPCSGLLQVDSLCVAAQPFILAADTVDSQNADTSTAHSSCFLSGHMYHLIAKCFRTINTSENNEIVVVPTSGDQCCARTPAAHVVQSVQ